MSKLLGELVRLERDTPERKVGDGWANLCDAVPLLLALHSNLPEILRALATRKAVDAVAARNGERFGKTLQADAEEILKEASNGS